MVAGGPVGKGRPRYTRSGHTYTPKKTRDYESIVQAEYRRQVGNLPPFTGSVEIYITAYKKIAKSLPKYKKKRLTETLTPCTKKPDIDNILKIIMDALNGLAYLDDKQVTNAGACKFYDEVPHVEVTIIGEMEEQDERG